jgi:hypothetical protein
MSIEIGLVEGAVQPLQTPPATRRGYHWMADLIGAVLTCVNCTNHIPDIQFVLAIEA